MIASLPRPVARQFRCTASRTGERIVLVSLARNKMHAHRLREPRLLHDLSRSLRESPTLHCQPGGEAYAAVSVSAIGFQDSTTFSQGSTSHSHATSEGPSGTT